MSFLFCAIFEGCGVLASDKMILNSEGSFQVKDLKKFVRLKNLLYVGRSGNGNVSELMVATISGLVGVLDPDENLSMFDRKLKSFKEIFNPIYDNIPQEYRKTCDGGGQLMGCGWFEDRPIGFLVNYVPSQNDFLTQTITAPRSIISSNPDANAWMKRNLKRILIKSILGFGEYWTDDQMRKVCSRLYKELCKHDKTVSSSGSLILLREKTTAELEF